MRIRQLSISRFRGVRDLTWRPGPSVNCLVGPGDVGKSTVLQAIALAFQPQPVPPASEYDYFDRGVAEGFEITVVLGDLASQFTEAIRTPLLWMWKDGELHPITEAPDGEPVAVIRVRGTPDLEVIHELLAPSEEGSKRVSPTQRALVGMIRLLSDSGSGREFRFTRGGLLERHLQDGSLRNALSAALSEATRSITASDQAQPLVRKLRELFEREGLPTEVLLGLLTATESSMLAQVGLLIGADPVKAVPLSLAGRGTRQMATVALAAALSASPHIVVADEIESGLEPYRQRGLVQKIQRLVGSRGQVFFSTHSTTVLEMLDTGAVHYMTESRTILRPASPAVSRVLKRNPEALLARLPVICEGVTEQGLLAAFLRHFAERDRLEGPETLGISFVDGTGQPECLDAAEHLLADGVRCGLFVDREAKHAGRREALLANTNCAFGAWKEHTNVEETVAQTVPLNDLDGLAELACEVRFLLTGIRPRPESVLQKLRSLTNHANSGSIRALVGEIGEARTRAVLSQAMREQKWFKTYEGGQALGRFLLARGVPTPVSEVLEPFWTRVKAVLG